MRKALIRISQTIGPQGGLFPFLVVTVLLLGFGLLADEVMEGATTAFDNRIILALRNGNDLSNPIGPAWLQSMARDITALGSVVVLWIVLLAVVGYLFLAGKKVSAWLMLAAVLGGTALNSLLKLGFARPRPDLFIQSAKLLTSSFPSGHAALSAITYLTLAALLARTTASGRIRSYFIAIGILITLSVGVSRVYLGVHYPTDVLAGWCVGSAWALGCWAIFSLMQQQGKAEPPGTDQSS